MRIIIEVEAGGSVGLGHAGRTAALATRLLDHGAEVVAVVHGDDAGRLTGIEGVQHGTGDEMGDWIVVDLPDPLTETAVAGLRRRGQLCVIDDDGPALQLADLAICPPTSPWPTAPASAIVGPDAVLVRQEFCGAKARVSHDGPLVVSMGGTGGSVTTVVATALWRKGRAVRTLHPHPLDLPDEVEQYGSESEDAARVHEGASLMLTAYGHTPLEAATRGVPSALITWPHQRAEDAAWFTEVWQTGWFLGQLPVSSPPDPSVGVELAERTLECLRDVPRWEAVRAGLDRFDGGGAARVVARLLARAEA